ncbi:ankyrin repeat domain-containing protein SOWAHC [Echeneis naucrates]|uniref:Ankyrin repeat domain-containing protein SOWAHC-like n=1 Tax=Echeneis naucrates TaxID=173247 RepID=A0A665W5W5_ECHNA|nr:ankyrin repeat domain-containing protein SOWAHC-like [Echeneis naucrates]
MALTQESILSFLLDRGGKVKNSELLNNFRSHIGCSDPAERLHNRDLFKKLVNSVAVVKQVDEVNFVVVKKRYRDFVKEATHGAPQRTPMDDSVSSSNASFRYTSPHRMTHSDCENNNMSSPLVLNANHYGDRKHESVGSVQKTRPSSGNISCADATSVKVLNISADHASRVGKSGAVFAVISVKSPPRKAETATHDGSHLHMHRQKTSHTPAEVSAGSLQSPKVPKIPKIPSCKKGAFSELQRRQSRQTVNSQTPSFPQGRPQNRTAKQLDDANSESVPLQPSAHEWLVKCAAGQWNQIYALLLQNSQLAQKKDFMSGFTALHWAAKDGNSKIIHKLVEITRQRGTYIDINSKAHGGYTPLHIAAIHGHTEVMLLLVQGYGANINERDNAGKKACHYLGKGVSAEVGAVLGGLQWSKHKERTEEDYREHPKGFNTISKLFQPHIGKKPRTATKFAHDW